jgi:hypothetical protein
MTQTYTDTREHVHGGALEDALESATATVADQTPATAASAVGPWVVELRRAMARGVGPDCG